MRWQGRKQSENVEDRRGIPVGKMAIGGGLGTLLLVLVVTFLGGDPQELLNQMPPPGADPAAGPGQVDPAEQPLKEFVSVVLADTEDVWRDLFQTQRAPYRAPKLVLYTGEVRTGAGLADAAMGPFYVPADECVYLDLSFCTTNLKDREVFHKDPRPTGADHSGRAVARIGWRPCRPGKS